MKYKLSLLLLIASLPSLGQFITNTGIPIYNSGVVATNGEWINEGEIENDGTIVTSGNWINNGTLSTASTGGFVLRNTEPGTFMPGGVRFSFLEMNASADVDVYLDGEVIIADSLTLRSGVLRVLAEPGSANNPVLRIDVGKKVEATPNSYVDGTMAASGTGQMFFPLGREEHYLPLTLHQLNAQHVIAYVDLAPPGYVAGPGVDSLINFPYLWVVGKMADTDTSGYVEVSYPNTLPRGANPILAREINGQRYASMGARMVTEDTAMITLKSYSRRLSGWFTVANGFPADLETDSLALVALYQITGGNNWITNTNWLSGELSSWVGVEQTGQSITGIALPSNNLAGIVPESLRDIQALRTVDLSDNSITSIPDFSGHGEIESLNVSGNRLSFHTLEPNAPVAGFEYANQATLGEPVSGLLPVGSPYEIINDAGGVNSVYTWKKNGTVIPAQTTSTLQIPTLNRSTMGTFVTEATNSLLPGLTLTFEPHEALAYATVAGTLRVDAATPAAAGQVTLFRITDSAYDTLAPTDVTANGTFYFDQVVLDDYQLLGFADTLVHHNVLPTWYSNALLWEEADTLRLEDHVDALTIVSYNEPTPSSGIGIIDGFLEEDDVTESGVGRSQALKRIQGAAVVARRVESAGRGEDEILTLVAYVFTDENGEFRIDQLPQGTYRLNIQYPGYPMDETSFTSITIGSSLESHVSVAARVEEGKINVKKVIITGIAPDERHTIDVWPNPAADRLQMKFASADPGRTLVIVDLNGREVLTQTAPGTHAEMEIAHIGHGMYLIHVKESTGTRTIKLAIE